MGKYNTVSSRGQVRDTGISGLWHQLVSAFPDSEIQNLRSAVAIAIAMNSAHVALFAKRPCYFVNLNICGIARTTYLLSSVRTEFCTC